MFHTTLATLWRGSYSTWRLVRESVARFYADGGPMLAGSLAFYSVLTIAPLLVFAVVLAGTLLGREAARLELQRYVYGALGREGGTTVWNFVERLEDLRAQSTAAVLGFVVIVYAGHRLFLQIREALNLIFGVRAKRLSSIAKGAKRVVKTRVSSLLVVLASGVLIALLLVTRVALTAALQAFEFAQGSGVVFQLAEYVVSTVILCFLFTVFFQVLPDAKIAWQDALVGALLTSVLFGVSTFILGVYVAHVVSGSLYGAVGSFALLLLWLHYNAQVFLLGAEFTSVWAEKRGRAIEPTRHAERLVTSVRP